MQPVERLLGERVIDVDLGDGRSKRVVYRDIVYDVPFERMLEVLLEYNSDFRKNLLDSFKRFVEKKRSGEP